VHTGTASEVPLCRPREILRLKARGPFRQSGTEKWSVDHLAGEHSNHKQRLYTKRKRRQALSKLFWRRTQLGWPPQGGWSGCAWPLKAGWAAPQMTLQREPPLGLISGWGWAAHLFQNR